jgi:pimeloyl-ACP methyl ester carboxylesterase
MTIHRFEVDLPHGITLSCRSNVAALTAIDRARPRVLLLHGFPEAAFVWDDVISRLGGDAALLAPNLRGFERSSAPTDVASYRVRHLVQDLTALIDAFGAPIDLLVAHDWGGALAWALAAQRPDLMRHLCIINAPHAATFLRELKANPAQQAASAYMNWLCRPEAASELAADDFRRLWRMLELAGGASWLDDATRDRYRDVWRRGLDGPLNYYRASPLRPPVDDRSPIHAVVFEDKDVHVRVPTTVLWAEGDIALLPALLDGLDEHVDDLRIERAPGTHWIVHERPELVVDTIRGCVPQPKETR